MLVYVTGVPGSGKSTLRGELERLGYRAHDADEGFCAWFDLHGQLVPTLPLSERTPEWYAGHQWRLLADRVRELSEERLNGVGFLLGVAANAHELSAYFDHAFYLTAETDVIVERLRRRDGPAYATRFDGAASVEDWNATRERGWAGLGYTALDGSGAPADVAEALIRLVV
jgi:shikimate kinase